MSAEAPRNVVLFVDDDVALLDGIRNLLRREPYEIVTASSGAEALEVLGQRTVDVIVCDECMPGMSGATLLHHLRTRYPRTLRIMLTGVTGPKSLGLAAEAASTYRFLNKPCSPHELAETVRTALAAKNLPRRSVKLR